MFHTSLQSKLFSNINLRWKQPFAHLCVYPSYCCDQISNTKQSKGKDYFGSQVERMQSIMVETIDRSLMHLVTLHLMSGSREQSGNGARLENLKA